MIYVNGSIVPKGTNKGIIKNFINNGLSDAWIIAKLYGSFKFYNYSIRDIEHEINLVKNS